MAEEKIKAFFSQKKEELATKIERTPMDKFFIFFLILITGSALVLGYLQFKKNLESPLYSSYLGEIRGQLREQYNNNVNQTAPVLKNYLGQSQDINSVWDQLQASGNTNGAQATQPSGVGGTNINSAGSLYGAGNLSDLTDLENKLISGEITLQQLGIDDPALQKVFDELGASQQGNVNSALSTADKQAALEQLKNLTPAEIRQEMEGYGIDKATLDQIDDQTLQQLFLDTISSY